MGGHGIKAEGESKKREEMRRGGGEGRGSNKVGYIPELVILNILKTKPVIAMKVFSKHTFQGGFEKGVFWVEGSFYPGLHLQSILLNGCAEIFYVFKIFGVLIP